MKYSTKVGNTDENKGRKIESRKKFLVISTFDTLYVISAATTLKIPHLTYHCWEKLMN